MAVRRPVALLRGRLRERRASILGGLRRPPATSCSSMIDAHSVVYPKHGAKRPYSKTTSSSRCTDGRCRPARQAWRLRSPASSRAAPAGKLPTIARENAARPRANTMPRHGLSRRRCHPASKSPFDAERMPTRKEGLAAHHDERRLRTFVDDDARRARSRRARSTACWGVISCGRSGAVNTRADAPRPQPRPRRAVARGAHSR